MYQALRAIHLTDYKSTQISVLALSLSLSLPRFAPIHECRNVGIAAGDPPTWAAQGHHLGRGGFDDVIGTAGLEKVG